MSFNTAVGKAKYVIGIGQANYTFVFKIYEGSDIVVQTSLVKDGALTTLAYGLDYTVSINGDNGGTVTVNAGLTAGGDIIFIRSLPITRDIEYFHGGDIAASTLNIDQNYQTYLIMDNYQALLDRQTDAEKKFYHNNPAVVDVGTEMPAPIANLILGWSSDAKKIVNLDPSSVSTGGFNRVDGVATLGQTDINVSPYDTAYINIYINGSLQTIGSDYIVSGSIVKIAKPMEVDDEYSLIVGSTASSAEKQTFSVEKIVDLSGVPLLYKTVIVRENGRGGTFNYDSSLANVNNNGTIFDGWVRQYDTKYLSVDWFHDNSNATHDIAFTKCFQACRDLGKYMELSSGIVYLQASPWGIDKATSDKFDDFTLNGNGAEIHFQNDVYYDHMISLVGNSQHIRNVKFRGKIPIDHDLPWDFYKKINKYVHHSEALSIGGVAPNYYWTPRATTQLSQYAKDIVVENCTFKDVNGPINIHCAGDITVRDNIIDNYTETGIFFRDMTTNVRCTDNIMRTGNDDGIFVFQPSFNSGYQDAGLRSYGVFIDGNSIDFNRWTNIGVSGVSDVIISNNVCSNSLYYNIVYRLHEGSFHWANGSECAKNIKIDNNICRFAGGAATSGHVTPQWRQPSAVYSMGIGINFEAITDGSNPDDFWVEDISIENNRIESSFASAISMSHTKRLNITNNTITTNTVGAWSDATTRYMIELKDCYSAMVDGNKYSDIDGVFSSANRNIYYFRLAPIASHVGEVTVKNDSIFYDDFVKIFDAMNPLSHYKTFKYFPIQPEKCVDTASIVGSAGLTSLFNPDGSITSENNIGRVKRYPDKTMEFELLTSRTVDVTDDELALYGGYTADESIALPCIFENAPNILQSVHGVSSIMINFVNSDTNNVRLFNVVSASARPVKIALIGKGTWKDYL